MADSQPPRGSRIFTVLRGDALRDSRTADLPVTQATPAAPLPDDGNPQTIYGVPASAVQHCCGRGCKHCRIYWHRLKP